MLTITSIVFSFRGNLSDLIQVFQNSAFEFQLISAEEAKKVVLFYSPAIVFGLFGLYKVVGNPKIRAHAQKAQQTTLIWLFFSLIAVTNFPAYHRINFVFLLPPFAYLGINLFYLIKKNWQRELILWTLVGSVVLTYQLDEPNIAKPRRLSINQEKLLILGPEMEEYLYNQMAGPFVNWELAKPLLSQLNTYKNVIIVQEYFNKDQPTYIYDSEGYFSKIGQHLPSLTQQYELVSPKLYKKK